LRELIIESKAANEETLKEIDKDIKSIVTDAAEFAKESPEPDVAELYTDILVEVSA